MMEHLTDEQFFDYIDGSCSAAERQLYQTHLAGCTGCRALYDEYRAVDAQLAAFALQPAPVQFTDKLMETWAASQPVQPVQAPVAYRRSKTIFWALPVAACALLFVVFFSLWFAGQLPASAQENPVALDATLSGVSLGVSGLASFFQQEWLLNGFLLVNAVLGLLLFDKLVLKPFFEKKRQALAG
jgi:anti-sigma factor RsiW